MSLWRSLASTIVSELRLAEQREGADAANIKEVVRQLKTSAGNVRRPGEAPTDNIKKQDYIMKFTFTFGLDKFSIEGYDFDPRTVYDLPHKSPDDLPLLALVPDQCAHSQVSCNWQKRKSFAMTRFDEIHRVNNNIGLAVGRSGLKPTHTKMVLLANCNRMPFSIKNVGGQVEEALAEMSTVLTPHHKFFLDRIDYLIHDHNIDPETERTPEFMKQMFELFLMPPDWSKTGVNVWTLSFETARSVVKNAGRNVKAALCNH